MSEAEVAARQKQLLSQVPEFGVKDMAAWFRFVVLIRPTLLQSLQVCGSMWGRKRGCGVRGENMWGGERVWGEGGECVGGRRECGGERMWGRESVGGEGVRQRERVWGGEYIPSSPACRGCAEKSVCMLSSCMVALPPWPPQLTPMVDCCVALLERPDLLPSPLAQGRIVSMLLAFVNSDQREPTRR